MAYYPKSQIKTDLYTNGGEFIILLTGEDYKGYYYSLSSNAFFSGKNPQDLQNQQLLPIQDPSVLIDDAFLKKSYSVALFNEQAGPPQELIDDPLYKRKLVHNYYKLNPQANINILYPPLTYLPFYSPTIPTQQDYQNKKFTRYFCKKTNEIIYLEISKDIYNKLINQDPQIAYQLYQPFTLSWQLTGVKEEVYKSNKATTEVTSVKQKLPMLSAYLKEDFTKYYK